MTAKASPPVVPKVLTPAERVSRHRQRTLTENDVLWAFVETVVRGARKSEITLKAQQLWEQHDGARRRAARLKRQEARKDG